MIVITKDILSALHQAVEQLGTLEQLSKKTGIAKSSLSRYVSGFTTNINDTTWKALEPYLRPYLPHESVTAGVIGAGRNYGPVIGNAGSVIHRTVGATPEELAACRAATLGEVLDAVMESDIDDAAKIRFYGILKQLKKGE